MNILLRLGLGISVISLISYYQFHFNKNLNTYINKNELINNDSIIIDAATNYKAMAAIKNEPNLKSMKVILHTKDAIVVANGSVYTQAEKDLINNKILSVSGVKGITNNLTVKPQ